MDVIYSARVIANSDAERILTWKQAQILKFYPKEIFSRSNRKRYIIKSVRPRRYLKASNRVHTNTYFNSSYGWLHIYR